LCGPCRHMERNQLSGHDSLPPGVFDALASLRKL
jgi:hypothetical protein